jgi:ABC-type bacteriocin/lantibiotic exporter with double-glycine peptidase domain
MSVGDRGSDQPESESPLLEALNNPQHGLNVVDFAPPGIFWSIKKATTLLNPGKLRLLFFAAGIQISLGILDLIGILLVGLLAAVAVSGIGVSRLPDWLTSVIDNLGLGGLTISQLSVALALTAVLTLVLKTFLSALMARRITHFLANRQADLSVSLASDFLSRPLSQVQRWTTSEAIYALGSGAGAATVALLGSAITIAAEVFLFTIIGISLFIYDPILTFIAGSFFGLIVFFMHRTLTRMSARNAQTVTDASIDTLTAVSEALSTYRETMVLNRRDLYIDRYSRLVGKYANASAANSFIVEIPKYVLEAALYIGVLLLGVVQFLTRDWAAAATTVGLFLAAGSRVMPSLLRLQGAGITIKNASVQAQPTFFMHDYLKSNPTTHNTPSQRITATIINEKIEGGFKDFQATVVVDSITHTYPDAAEPALLDINLTIPEGSSAAFVGSTGAGKSTLSDIILGVLEPDSGTVTISGVTPREAINRWPGALTYVPQVVALVAGSVRDNVALGLPSEFVNDDLVWEALERAHLASFLKSAREGLGTSVGERGFRLSGGQRQRLGIARALFTRPKLLILDEATSSLDSETEQAITDTLRELEGNVTTITVAHRLATVRLVDQVVFFKDGKLVTKGTFEEVRENVPDFRRQAELLGL